MTLNDILAKAGKTVEDITKIYHGKDNWCRCGCGGNYFEHNRPEDSRGFKRAINLLNKPERFDFAVRTDEIECNKTYINIPFGDEYDNKCYCIYFD